jgi:hypothetical protein
MKLLIMQLKRNTLYCDTDSFVYTSRGMMGSDASRWQHPEGDLYKMALRLCSAVLIELEMAVDAGRRGLHGSMELNFDFQTKVPKNDIYLKRNSRTGIVNILC